MYTTVGKSSRFSYRFCEWHY